MYNFKSYKFVGIIIGVISGVLWGLNDVYINLFSIKIDILSTSILTIVFSLLLAFIQDVSSCSCIFTYHILKSRKSFYNQIKDLKSVILLLFLAAIFAGPLGMVAGIAGITYAGPIYAGVITSCYPVTALIFAILFLKEKPTSIKIIGILMSVIAVISISIAGESNGGSQIIVGILFAICAMLGWGLESILFSLALRKTTRHDSSFLLAARQFCSAVSYVICLLIIFYFYRDDLLKVLEHFFIAKMIIVCVLSAMTSYLAYYNAIKRVGASLGTTFNATFIFWAGIFSVLFNLSHITVVFILWGCVLIFGIYLATKGTISQNQVVA